MQIDLSFASRFWERVSTRPTRKGCLLWLRSTTKAGYGNLRVYGKVQIASRVSYALAHGGYVPDEMDVLHTCDNPPCVNPEHLFLGNDLDNARDRAKKGRSYRPIGDLHPSRTHPECLARGERNGTHTHPERVSRGEGHYRAKLTDEDIRIIRRKHEAGVPSRELGRQYGVSHRMILLISRRKSWAHVK